MMVITNKLKERFCKDCRIPIKVFDEPYFTQRLEILDSVYESIKKWEKFKKSLERYHCEQDFFEDYNRVKQAMIDYIKESKGYEKFNSDDMNKYCNTRNNLIELPKNVSSDIYKSSNVGQWFISLDIKKANFTALKHYGGIFDEFETYEDFIKKFTDNPHFIESKYIREVIFGNCNPKRHITYERYLVDKFLNFLLNFFMRFRPMANPYAIFSDICFVSNDEIIFKCNESSRDSWFERISIIADEFKKEEGIEFKPELFFLKKISGNVECYVKEIVEPEIKLDFKCCNSNDVHCVVKYIENKEITDDDLVFINDGKLAKYLTAPVIEYNK